ncbi:hypothetical protein [Halomonas sp.]|uniref:hypothetical protein n=1 Tax=Halomonas sp. TaxID=1486246 RepID=UPI003D0FB345
MKAAIIENGKVVNIAKVADAEFAESQGWIVSDTARIGDDYDAQTGEFTTPAPPPPPVPRSVSRRQGKQQLVIAGLDDQVQQAIDGISDATERKLTRIWFDDADTWERDNEQLVSLAQALSLTEQQVDDLFTAAAQL